MNAFAWFFLSLHGRVSRQEFWLGYVGIVVVALILARALPYQSGALYFISDDVPRDGASQSASFWLGWPELISLVLTWPVIAIYAKRLHDLNLSAWWLLLLPAVTFAVGLSVFNRLDVAGYCLLLLVLGFLPGTSGPNRFGEDPRARPQGAKPASDR
jgi:uncharacterized membrane protein YhaH (DUF805 family)